MGNYTGSIPDTAARRLDWMDHMACRTVDPDLFSDPATEHKARTICVARCPVRRECLAAVKEAERGTAREHRDGVVAGLAHNERWRLDADAARGKGDPRLLVLDGTERCGTYPALLGHLWRGERVDGVCWSGQAQRVHDNRAWRQRTGDEPEPPEAEPVEQAPPVEGPAAVAAVEPISPEVKSRPRPRGKTPHERRIYDLWSSGLSDLDIARRMDVSVPSVQRVRERLGLVSNLHARKAS